MYTLKIEHSFDSAHFLSGYTGKCSNIHGHRWKIEVEIQSNTLVTGGQLDGMIMDFSDLKGAVKDMLDYYDHALIIEKGSMREETLSCIEADGFKVIKLDFRPTAENLAAYFFKSIKDMGFIPRKVTVFETPTNCAAFEEGSF